MKTIIKEHFNSIEEMLNKLKTREKNSIMKYKDGSVTNDYGFCKTSSYEDAENLIQFGYSDPLNEIKSKIKINGLNTTTIKFENNVYGYIPNVPNAIQGLPNSMINITSQPKKINVIDIIYCPVGNASVGSSEFIEAGIKILNVINTLELNKIKVRLRSSILCAYSEDEITLATLQLKNYNEKLNLLKMCFPLAHPSFLRRFGFRWLETTPEITDDKWEWGYGKSLRKNSEEIKILKKSLNKHEKLLLFDEIKDLEVEEILNLIIK